jgi:dephospho-CoA kinase
MSQKIVTLVGMPGTGKSLCALHLEERGFYQFRFGSIVTDEVIRRGLPLNPQNEQAVREEFRAQEGMDAIARRALPYLRNGLETHDNIVIDGLYSFSEYKTLSAALNLVVVAIASPRTQRYARLANRPERPLTAAEAQARDYAEIENLEKGGPIAIADYTLVNAGLADDLLTQLDALLEELDIRP